MVTLLNCQYDLPKQSVNMMHDMIWRHEYDNLIRDVPIYGRKNLVLADWQLQIEKVALLTNSQEYGLAMAKLTSTLYKMLKRMDRDRNWLDIEMNWKKCTHLLLLKDMWLVIYIENRGLKTLEEYIQNCTDLMEKVIGVDPTNTNWVIIFLFMRNLYNKDMRWSLAVRCGALPS